MKKYKTFRNMFFCIAGFGLGFCSVAGASGSSFLDVQALCEAWDSSYAGIESMKVAYTEKVLDTTPPADRPQALDHLVRQQHVERIEAGKRYHIRYSTAKDGFADPENLMQHAFDGESTREYWANEKLGTRDKGLIGRDVETKNIFKHYLLADISKTKKYADQYPGGVPRLSRLLRFSKTTVKPQLEEVTGTPCHVIEIDDKGENYENQFNIWLAHDKGFLPLKYQWYKDGRLVEEIQVDQIGRTAADTGSVWYPVKAYRTTNWDNVGKIKYELATHEFESGMKVSKADFQFDFPIGTEVVDRVANINYKHGADIPDLTDPVWKAESKQSRTKPAACPFADKPHGHSHAAQTIAEDNSGPGTRKPQPPPAASIENVPEKQYGLRTISIAVLLAAACVYLLLKNKAPKKIER